VEAGHGRAGTGKTPIGEAHLTPLSFTTCFFTVFYLPVGFASRLHRPAFIGRSRWSFVSCYASPAAAARDFERVEPIWSPVDQRCRKRWTFEL